MTILDRFMEFARALPEDRLGPVEDILAAIMAGADPAGHFTQDELVELDLRLDQADPQYASDDEVRALFERSRPR